MKRVSLRGARLFVMAVPALLFSACPPGPGNSDGGPNLPPDICTSQAEALSSAQCALVLDGGPVTAYIGFKGDVDFWRIDTPPSLNGRSLVHVVAGYPNNVSTPVELAVNMLDADGGTSFGGGVDRHGSGAPGIVDLLFRDPYSGKALIAIVDDGTLNATAPGYDVRNQYAIRAELLTDPDVNEPNDTIPTPVSLTSSSGALVGTQSGYLSVTNDVDLFSIAVPAQGSPRKILYLHLTAPLLNPPPPFQLAYTLFAPDGTQISQGNAANAYIPVDLATARIALAARGTYTVSVRGFQQTPGVAVPGDLRLRYQLDVKILDEQDANEPNDTMATAKAASFAAGTLDGAPLTFVGRLDHVPDEDWFKVTFPSQSAPTVLHYKLTPLSSGGRFAPFPIGIPPLDGGTGLPLADRQLRIVTQAPSVPLCNDADAGYCPKGDLGDMSAQGLEAAFCGMSPSQCIWSERDENLFFDNIRNFEGTIPIYPSGNPGSYTAYYLEVRSAGDDFADDKDYRLDLWWKSDSDEVAKYAGQATEQTTNVGTMTVDAPSTTYPAPPSGATTLSGTISHGQGLLKNFDSSQGQGIRGPNDYDAVPTDIDRFQINLPAVTAPYDRAWEIQWSVDHAPDGGYVHDIELELTFCDGTQTPTDGGSCVTVSSAGGSDLGLAWITSPGATWYGPRLVPYVQDVTSARTTVTAQANGCFCIEPRFMLGGKMFINVVGIDRQTYDVVPYTIHTAITSYPQAFGDGGTCPAPTGVDAGAPDAGGYAPGCRLTR